GGTGPAPQPGPRRRPGSRKPLPGAAAPGDGRRRARPPARRRRCRPARPVRGSRARRRRGAGTGDADLAAAARQRGRRADDRGGAARTIPAADRHSALRPRPVRLPAGAQSRPRGGRDHRDRQRRRGARRERDGRRAATPRRGRATARPGRPRPARTGDGPRSERGLDPRRRRGGRPGPCRRRRGVHDRQRHLLSCRSLPASLRGGAALAGARDHPHGATRARRGRRGATVRLGPGQRTRRRLRARGGAIGERNDGADRGRAHRVQRGGASTVGADSPRRRRSHPAPGDGDQPAAVQRHVRSFGGGADRSRAAKRRPLRRQPVSGDAQRHARQQRLHRLSDRHDLAPGRARHARRRRRRRTTEPAQLRPDPGRDGQAGVQGGPGPEGVPAQFDLARDLRPAGPNRGRRGRVRAALHRLPDDRGDLGLNRRRPAQLLPERAQQRDQLPFRPARRRGRWRRGRDHAADTGRRGPRHRPGDAGDALRRRRRRQDAALRPAATVRVQRRGRRGRLAGPVLPGDDRLERAPQYPTVDPQPNLAHPPERRGGARNAHLPADVRGRSGAAATAVAGRFLLRHPALPVQNRQGHLRRRRRPAEQAADLGPDPGSAGYFRGARGADPGHHRRTRQHHRQFRVQPQAVRGPRPPSRADGEGLLRLRRGGANVCLRRADGPTAGRQGARRGAARRHQDHGRDRPAGARLRDGQHRGGLRRHVAGTCRGAGHGRRAGWRGGGRWWRDRFGARCRTRERRRSVARRGGRTRGTGIGCCPGPRALDRRDPGERAARRDRRARPPTRWRSDPRPGGRDGRNADRAGADSRRRGHRRTRGRCGRFDRGVVGRFRGM
ncbi:MAG: hypothetical protein AVDCRST_MAG73-713, partial [uncultured Thermomicrobiales bacterium]